MKNFRYSVERDYGHDTTFRITSNTARIIDIGGGYNLGVKDLLLIMLTYMTLRETIHLKVM